MAGEGPSLAEQEEMLKKKYGGMIPKKKGLLSKGHERAYFDSAEWAMKKKQEQEAAAAAAAAGGAGLQPKLEPTTQPNAARKSSLAD